MSCKPVCRLCDRLVISQAVAFTGGNLEINLPAGSYNNGEKYCVVVGQAIPDTTTINAPVYFTIHSLSDDKAELRSGHRLWHPYPDQILSLCRYYPNRRFVPYAGHSLLLPQQQPNQH